MRGDIRDAARFFRGDVVVQRAQDLGYQLGHEISVQPLDAGIPACLLQVDRLPVA